VTRMIRLMTVAAVVVLSSGAMYAQENSGVGGRPTAAAPARGSFVPLKVTVVLSRFQGEKKISSLPYTLFVTTNPAENTRLRMGTQVPVPTTVLSGTDPATVKPVQSYNYKDVGTNIDCSASSAEEGIYKITLTVADSAVYFPDKSEAMVASSMTGAPAFRSFNASVNVLLRDGQTVQYTSVVDPVSGQTIKLEATLNVQK
jgi:hypothetical protein